MFSLIGIDVENIYKVLISSLNSLTFMLVENLTKSLMLERVVYSVYSKALP